MRAETYSFFASRPTSVLRISTKPEEPKMKSERAEMVARLLAIRNKAIANGMKLQTMDEIRSEIEASREFGA